VWSPEFYQQHSELWEGERQGGSQDLDRLRELLVNKLEGRYPRVDGWYCRGSQNESRSDSLGLPRDRDQLSALIVVSLNVRSEGKIA